MDAVIRHKRKLIIGAMPLLILGFLVFLPIEKERTRIFLDPQSKTVIQNDAFIVKIKFNAITPANAIEGTLNFDKEILEITDISVKNSVIGLWAKNPEFSNASGILSFAGGITELGYSGEGEILSITFLAKKAGSANVNFSEAEILAGDGQGTDLPKETAGAEFTIVENLPLIPDFNQNGKINLSEWSRFLSYFHTKKVNFTNFSIILSK